MAVETKAPVRPSIPVQRSPMKKHEACYHLNKIIEERRRQLEGADKPVVRTKVRDSQTNEQRDMTDDEMAAQQRWQERYYGDMRLEIEALDIAAASLTK